MDLLDRYVNAVRTHLPQSLPRAQQDDILQELSENIQAQMDDRASELRRPLTEDEQESILQQHGHPMVVASRYQTNSDARLVFGRELVGVTLFPLYLRVLRINLGIAFGAYLLVLIGLIVSGNGMAFGDVLTTVVLIVAIQFVVITIIFAAVERYVPSMPWSARGLPAPQVARNVSQAPRVPRMESVAAIIGIVVLVIWASIVLENPALLFGPAAATYQLAPVWQTVALPTLLILAVSIAQAVVNLIHPEWVRFRRAVRLATDIAGLGILIYLLNAGAWVSLVRSSGSNGALHTINQFVYYGLLCLLVGLVITIAMDGWKLIRGEQGRERQQPQIA
jgi:hypothetical protein